MDGLMDDPEMWWNGGAVLWLAWRLSRTFFLHVLPMLCGFPRVTLVSSHSQKTCKLD